MKVSLFFDGANFFSGWADKTGRRRIGFGKLASWLVERVGGTRLWGAYYYTGVEVDDQSRDASTEGLDRFLDALEVVPGFFVKRLPRKSRSRTCPSCGALVRFTQEKEVDTTMVAEMLGLAHADAFDICVLASGDADFCPAVEGVRSLGKQVYVATWGTADLSQRLRRVAFGHIDLLDGLSEFALDATAQDAPSSPSAPAGEPGREPDSAVPRPTGEEAFIAELRRAQGRFAGGYVGLNLFVTRWESALLDPSEEERRDILDRLTAAGKVEIYQTADNTRAIRVKDPA